MHEICSRMWTMVITLDLGKQDICLDPWPQRAPRFRMPLSKILRLPWMLGTSQGCSACGLMRYHFQNCSCRVTLRPCSWAGSRRAVDCSCWSMFLWDHMRLDHQNDADTLPLGDSHHIRPRMSSGVWASVGPPWAWAMYVGSRVVSCLLMVAPPPWLLQHMIMAEVGAGVLYLVTPFH